MATAHIHYANSDDENDQRMRMAVGSVTTHFPNPYFHQGLSELRCHCSRPSQRWYDRYDYRHFNCEHDPLLHVQRQPQQRRDVTAASNNRAQEVTD
jgi:hypothetical protein